MDRTGDANETATPDDGREFDPREAATLLEQTKRQAQREFDLRPPLVTLIRAAVILAGYGAVWLSGRGQPPHQGPTGAALPAGCGARILVVGVSPAGLLRAPTRRTGPTPLP